MRNKRAIESGRMVELDLKFRPNLKYMDGREVGVAVGKGSLKVGFGLVGADGKVSEYSPLVKSLEFHHSRAGNKMLSGAIRSSKSITIGMEGIILNSIYGGNRGLVARETYPQLRDTTQHTIFREIKVRVGGGEWESFIDSPLIKHYGKNENTVTMWNDSTMLFRYFSGCGTDDDGKDWKSMTLGWGAVDEAVDCNGKILMMLSGRICKVDVGYRGLLFATNPGNKAHILYKWFFENEDRDFFVVKARPHDNPYLPKDYLAKLYKIYTPAFARRYLEGEWGSFEGQIYTDFDERLHVLDDIEIDEQYIYCKYGNSNWKTKLWGLYRGIDFGSDHPFVCLWIALGQDKKWYVIDEHYANKMLIRDHKNQIKIRNYKNIKMTFGDHDHQLRSELEADYGDGFRVIVTLADKEILAGIQTVQRALSVQGDGKVGLFVNKNKCKHTIEQFLGYSWDKTKDMPVGKDDDTMDALRYVIHTATKNRLFPMLMSDEQIFKKHCEDNFRRRSTIDSGSSVTGGRYQVAQRRAII